MSSPPPHDKTTGTAHEVVDNGYDADISPDGTKFVFARSTGTNSHNSDFDLFEADIDGSNVTQLTSGVFQKYESQPTWNPSGTRIAFAETGIGIGIRRLRQVDVLDVDRDYDDLADREHRLPGLATRRPRRARAAGAAAGGSGAEAVRGGRGPRERQRRVATTYGFTGDRPGAESDDRQPVAPSARIRVSPR